MAEFHDDEITRLRIALARISKQLNKQTTSDGLSYAQASVLGTVCRRGPIGASELADVEGLKRLLTEDVLMEMPPMLNWFTGRGNYGLFMEWVFAKAGKDWVLKEVAANGGQPGFAAYRRAGGGYELHTVQIFTVTAGGISRNSVFQAAEVFAAFGLAPGLEIS